MENLVFFVILLIVIVANVINLKKRAKGMPGDGIPAGNPASGDYSGAGASWEEIELSPYPDGPPGDALYSGQAEPARLEEGMLTQKEKRQERRFTGLREGREGNRDQLIERRVKEALPSVSRQATARHDAKKPIKDESEAQKRGGPETKDAADPSVFRIGDYSVAELQRAVMWSEVLGPPVALRKGHGE